MSLRTNVCPVRSAPLNQLRRVFHGAALTTMAIVFTAMTTSCALKGPTDLEVRTLLEDQAAAWSKGDLEGFMRPYASDALFVTKDGVTRGSRAIYDRYNKRYRSEGKEMGKLTLTVADVRIEGRIARVALEWSLVFTGAEAARGMSLVIFEQRGDELLVVEDASM